MMRLILYHEPTFYVKVEIPDSVTQWSRFAHPNRFSLLSSSDESETNQCSATRERIQIHLLPCKKEEEQAKKKPKKKPKKSDKRNRNQEGSFRKESEQERKKATVPSARITVYALHMLVEMAVHNARILRQSQSTRESIFYRLPIAFWQTHILPFLVTPACQFAQTFIASHNHAVLERTIDSKRDVKHDNSHVSPVVVDCSRLGRVFHELNHSVIETPGSDWKNRRVRIEMEPPRVWCSVFPKDTGESKLFVSRCKCQEYIDNTREEIHRSVFSVCFPHELKFPSVDSLCAYDIAHALPADPERETVWLKQVNRIYIKNNWPQWVKNCLNSTLDPVLCRIWIWFWKRTEGTLRKRLYFHPETRRHIRCVRGWKHSLSEYAMNLMWYFLDPTRAKLTSLYTTHKNDIGNTIPAYGLVHPRMQDRHVVIQQQISAVAGNDEHYTKLTPEELKVWRRWNAKRMFFKYYYRNGIHTPWKRWPPERKSFRTKSVDARRQVLYISSVLKVPRYKFK